MVHNMFSHAGAVRIDHARPIPSVVDSAGRRRARGGAYVTYDYEAMIAILTIEASRVNGLVVGGIWAPCLITYARYSASTACWAAWWNGSPAWTTPPTPATRTPIRPRTASARWLPSPRTTRRTAGYLQFEHVKLREQLHLLSGPVEEFQASATDERNAMMDRLRGVRPDHAGSGGRCEGHIQEIVEAMHKMLLSRRPCCCRPRWWMAWARRAHRTQPGTSSESPTGVCRWQAGPQGGAHR